MEITPSIWNHVDVVPPPVCTVNSKWCKELRILNGTLEKIIITMDSFVIILHETKLLSRILKQLRGELRMDKIYQLAHKVIQCVKKCEVLNLKEVIVRTEKTSRQCNAFDYQPSRQMLEFNLVRLLGFINLLKFLVDLCHQCAIHLKGKMEIGHFPAVVLALFSIVSRIWSVSNYFLENAFEWYLLLLSSHKFLEPTPVQWLPSGFEFPALPLEFEQVSWINQNKILTSLRSFLSGFDEASTPSTNLQFLTKVDDLGVTISRKDFVSTGLLESQMPSHNKSCQDKSAVVHVKSLPAHKMVSGLNEGSSKASPKRKLVKLESRDDNSSFGKVKHFFKTKYTRPLIVQEPQSSEQQVKKMKLSVETVSSNLSGGNRNDVPDFMQELAMLKQDLEKSGGQSSSPSGERGAVDPKFKRKVVVVKDKRWSVSNKPPLKTDVKQCLTEVDEKISLGVDLDLTKSENVPIVRDVPAISHVQTVPEVGSVRMKGKMSKKSLARLEKMKEIVKLKKQKSKSWVIS